MPYSEGEHKQQRIYRVTGSYVGLAVGDALGAPVEHMSADEIAARYGVHQDMQAGGWLELSVGQTTDETGMCLAVGASILQHGEAEPHAIGEALSQWMQTNPPDMGLAVRRGIVHYRYSGIPTAPYDKRAAGSGACVRVLPVALATLGCSAEEIVHATLAQARVTHNNDLSDIASQCVVSVVQMAIQGATKEALRFGPVLRLVELCPQFDWEQEYRSAPSGFVVETLQAVFQAFFNTNSFEACLVDVVNRGGDADASGAIAGMIAGAYYGSDSIPSRWLQSLEITLRSACADQAVALAEMAPKYPVFSQGNANDHTRFLTID